MRYYEIPDYSDACANAHARCREEWAVAPQYPQPDDYHRGRGAGKVAATASLSALVGVGLAWWISKHINSNNG